MTINQKNTKKDSMVIGIVSYKGMDTMAYLNDDYSIDKLPLVLTGTQKSGKNTVFNYQNK